MLKPPGEKSSRRANISRGNNLLLQVDPDEQLPPTLRGAVMKKGDLKI